MYSKVIRPPLVQVDWRREKMKIGRLSKCDCSIWHMHMDKGLSHDVGAGWAERCLGRGAEITSAMLNLLCFTLLLFMSSKCFIWRCHVGEIFHETQLQPTLRSSPLQTRSSNTITNYFHLQSLSRSQKTYFHYRILFSLV